LRLAHYYHCFNSPVISHIINEHLDYLDHSGLAKELGVMHMGLVGGHSSDGYILDIAGRIKIDVVAEADEGWEQVTLDVLHDDACADKFDAALYLHSKGASDPSQWNDAWRRSMTISVVGHWRECIEKMEAGWDVVGCHWLTPQQFPQLVATPFYGGNAWWSTAEYLRTLPKPLRDTRHDAEAWLGQNNPKAYDLRPGWPGFNTIYPEAIR
jgi:hypothetical protein